MRANRAREIARKKNEVRAQSAPKIYVFSTVFRKKINFSINGDLAESVKFCESGEPDLGTSRIRKSGVFRRSVIHGTGNENERLTLVISTLSRECREWAQEQHTLRLKP